MQSRHLLTESVRRNRWRPRVALLIVSILLGVVFGTVHHGRWGNVTDEAAMLAVTILLAERQTPSIAEVRGQLIAIGFPAEELDPPYVKYNIGQSLVGLPAYLILRSIVGKAPIGAILDAPVSEYILLTGAWVTVVSSLGVFALACALGFGGRVAGLLMVLYGFTTLAWPYSKTFFNEPTSAACLVWMCAGAILARRKQPSRHAIWFALASGFCLGFAVLTRSTSAAFIPILFVFLLPHVWLVVGALPGVILGVLGMFGYNWLRYGSPLTSGYEAGFGAVSPNAVLGYLISPNRSMLLFNPILLLVIPGAVLLLRNRERRWSGLFLIVIIGLMILVYSAWNMWGGAGSLAARFIVPAIPLSVVLVAPVLERSGLWRFTVGSLAVPGLGVQILCNLVSPTVFYTDMARRLALSDPQIDWEGSNSFLFNAWRLYLNHPIDATLWKGLTTLTPPQKALLFSVVYGLLFAVAMVLVRIGFPTKNSPRDVSDTQ